jgi:hypothetical protein
LSIKRLNKKKFRDEGGDRDKIPTIAQLIGKLIISWIWRGYGSCQVWFRTGSTVCGLIIGGIPFTSQVLVWK